MRRHVAAAALAAVLLVSAAASAAAITSIPLWSFSTTTVAPTGVFTISSHGPALKDVTEARWYGKGLNGHLALEVVDYRPADAGTGSSERLVLRMPEASEVQVAGDYGPVELRFSTGSTWKIGTISLGINTYASLLQVSARQPGQLDDATIQYSSTHKVWGAQGVTTAHMATCRVDGGAPVPCHGGVFHADNLAPGSHTVTVSAYAGTSPVPWSDKTPASVTFTVPPHDTTAPETTIHGGPADGSAVFGNLVMFTFTSSEPSGFDCRYDGGAWQPCQPPWAVWSTTGWHVFEVRARDMVGNVDSTPDTRSFDMRGPLRTRLRLPVLP